MHCAYQVYQVRNPPFSMPSVRWEFLIVIIQAHPRDCGIFTHLCVIVEFKRYQHSFPLVILLVSHNFKKKVLFVEWDTRWLFSFQRVVDQKQRSLRLTSRLIRESKALVSRELVAASLPRFSPTKESITFAWEPNDAEEIISSKF